MGADAAAHPHAGFLHLDPEPGGGFVLTHALSLERAPMPSGEWIMEFDDAGFACCVRTDDESGEPVFCEEYLRRKVWLTDDGELFVEELRSRGGTGEVWSLSHMMQRWTESTLRLIYEARTARRCRCAFTLRGGREGMQAHSLRSVVSTMRWA